MTEPATARAGLRVLAVDDEPPALGELTYLLEQSDGVAAVVPAGSAAEALAALQTAEFDAVFLGRAIPGIDGLALAGILTRFATPPPVVFVTAYDNHAVDAFELAAVDYLLKPIRAERLALALAGSRCPRVPADRTRSRGFRLVRRGDPWSRLTPGPPADETIAVELGGVTRYVQRSDIVYVEAQRDYVRLCTRSGGHLVRVPLASLEERWGPAGFLRVHRRRLVNSSFVEALRLAAGRVSVDLGAGQSVPVSRRFTPRCARPWSSATASTGSRPHRARTSRHDRRTTTATRGHHRAASRRAPPDPPLGRRGHRPADTCRSHLRAGAHPDPAAPGPVDRGRGGRAAGRAPTALRPGAGGARAAGGSAPAVVAAAGVPRVPRDPGGRLVGASVMPSATRSSSPTSWRADEQRRRGRGHDGHGAGHHRPCRLQLPGRPDDRRLLRRGPLGAPPGGTRQPSPGSTCRRPRSSGWPGSSWSAGPTPSGSLWATPWATCCCWPWCRLPCAGPVPTPCPTSVRRGCAPRRCGWLPACWWW